MPIFVTWKATPVELSVYKRLSLQARAIICTLSLPHKAIATTSGKMLCQEMAPVLQLLVIINMH